MKKEKDPSDKELAVYTAYLNKLNEYGSMAFGLSKRFILAQIAPEFFISVSHGERIINKLLKKDLKVDTLRQRGLKRTTVQKILGIYFENDKSESE